MNSGYDYDKETGAIKFPSPTGVNHYEYKVIELIKAKEKQFPSPTGVKYYEYKWIWYSSKSSCNSFRPQQGLSIMNQDSVFL